MSNDSNGSRAGLAEALIGQRHAEALLARAVLSERLTHAYLFLGPAHCGKRTAAWRFARALQCERQPAALPDAGDGLPALAPCGACESCRRLAADAPEGAHPEVFEIVPGSRTGQEISVEQARELRTNAALRPRLGRRRIYLLPNAEALNEVSANALLKTLEEPSPFVTLILGAPSPSLVLPTIRSRCQMVRFGLAPREVIAAALVARGATPEVAAAAASASGGRPGLALAWLAEPAALERRGAVLDLFARALALRPEAARRPSVGVLALRLAEGLLALGAADAEERKRPPRAAHLEHLETGLAFLRDLLLLSGGAEPHLVQNPDRLPELRERARETSPHEAIQAVRVVREAQQLLERNVTPALVLERMFWALIAGPPHGSGTGHATEALFGEGWG